jgi:carbonic anhydrase
MDQQKISVVRLRSGRALRAAALSLLVVAAVVAPLPATDVAATCPPEWNYGADKGPDKWATLKPEWAVCGSGRAQSPIDIPQDDIHQDNNMYLPQPLYPRMKIRVDNTGNGIKVVPLSEARLHLGSNTYATLDEFHFHVPSEHRVHGVKEAGELHLVHRLADGRQIVYAVLLRAGGNTNNPMLQEIIDLMPAECGQSRTSPAATFDLTQLMAPNMAHYFFYVGSLTTPPCAEGVEWMVGAEALVVPQAQITALQAVSGRNARPVQPVRVIRWRQAP